MIINTKNSRNVNVQHHCHSSTKAENWKEQKRLLLKLLLGPRKPVLQIYMWSKPELPSKFQANQGYIVRLCLKKTTLGNAIKICTD